MAKRESGRPDKKRSSSDKSFSDRGPRSRNNDERSSSRGPRRDDDRPHRSGAKREEFGNGPSRPSSGGSRRGSEDRPAGGGRGRFDAAGRSSDNRRSDDRSDKPRSFPARGLGDERRGPGRPRNEDRPYSPRGNRGEESRGPGRPRNFGDAKPDGRSDSDRGNRGGYGSDNRRAGGSGGSDRRGGYGSDNRRSEGSGGSDRRGGYGSDNRRSEGSGGSDRRGGYGSDNRRSGGSGGSDRRGGYGSDNRKPEGSGGSDRRGGYGSDNRRSEGSGGSERRGGYGSDNRRSEGSGGSERRGGYGSEDRRGSNDRRSSGGTERRGFGSRGGAEDRRRRDTGSEDSGFRKRDDSSESRGRGRFDERPGGEDRRRKTDDSEGSGFRGRSSENSGESRGSRPARRSSEGYQRNSDSSDRPPRRRPVDTGFDDQPKRRKSEDEEFKPFKLSEAREKNSDDPEKSERKPRTEAPKRTHLGLSQDRAKTLKTRLDDADMSKVGKAEPIRLNRYISNSGVCSRREADDLIEAGVITVNGKTVTELGVRVSVDDEVRYDGQRIYPEKFRYVLLNKPKDYITTLDDPEGRQTVMFLVRKACKERIYPVGRLDRATTGLLLMTNDGDLAKRLTHPSHGVQKIYHVELDQKVDPSHLQKLREGITLEDGFIKADDVAFTGDGEDKKSVGIEIHSGRNRIVRRMFEYFGYNVKKLDRVVFAGLTKKDLPRGEHRLLTEKEVAFLHMLTGKGV